MKVKEAVNLCSKMADLDIPERYLLGNFDVLQDEKVARLVMCCNNVLEELYCDYATDIATCTVTAKDGFVDVSALYLSRVLSLTDSNGKNVAYRYTSGGLAVADGTYKLTYAKRPYTLYWEEEIVLPSPRITERIFLYGVLSEYFLLIGDPVSKAWETRYQDALHAASIKRSAMEMPARRWI